MAKNLVIVESPTKAKTISKFLGPDYIVEASMGHVRDLPKSKISIDVKNDFMPTYEITPKGKEVIANLKKLSKDAPKVILATDEDREGESISWHLAYALGLNTKTTERIVFHEITKSAIEHALQNPRHIDENLVNAQQARRILDRIVGYELSPFLWRKVRYGLSAGRVQSVAVRLIVERENEIRAFNSEEYWSVIAKLSKLDNLNNYFESKLIAIDGKKLDKFAINNSDYAHSLKKEIETANFEVADVTNSDVKRNPSAPFITSTLQQDSARKLGFSAKQTMMYAQKLYELGYITYMRTDSTNLAGSAIKSMESYILDNYGKDYLKIRTFTSKAKGAQEAHEAIRPTDINLKTVPLKGKQIESGHQRLYDLIWKRTIASQMSEAIFDSTTVDIKADEKFLFRSTGQVIKFDGFMKVYLEGKDDDEINTDNENFLPKLTPSEKLNLGEINAKQHFTEPPARYTDASLIKALETHGIGRPSTYAPTLTTIQEREYVTKLDKKYQPTETGEIVNGILVEHFPEIVDLNFTSNIEQKFDDIAEGKEDWVPIIRDFYTPFKKHIIEKEETVAKIEEESDVKCQHCGKFMLIKFGRNGQFLACPDPESRITKPLPEEEAKIKELTEKTKDELCNICGKHMNVRKGRFGYFLGCEDYPKCKGISKIWNKTGFKCPHCMADTIRSQKPGDIVEKKGRGRAKPFWACTLWPDCDLILNIQPENQEQLQELYKQYLDYKNNPKPKAKKVGRKTVKKKK